MRIFSYVMKSLNYLIKVIVCTRNSFILHQEAWASIRAYANACGFEYLRETPNERSLASHSTATASHCRKLDSQLKKTANSLSLPWYGIIHFSHRDNLVWTKFPHFHRNVINRRRSLVSCAYIAGSLGTTKKRKNFKIVFFHSNSDYFPRFSRRYFGLSSEDFVRRNATNRTRYCITTM